MTPQELRRLKALVPSTGVFINVDRAKRLFDATPADLPDEERVGIVRSVMAMLTAAEKEGRY